MLAGRSYVIQKLYFRNLLQLTLRVWVFSCRSEVRGWS